jgi:hypothetical protein
MDQKPGDRKPNMSVVIYMWLLPLAIGTAVGIGIGASFGSVGAGAAIGIGMGVTIGLVLYRRFKNRTSDNLKHSR